jgi:hypothetical protein
MRPFLELPMFVSRRLVWGGMTVEDSVGDVDLDSVKPVPSRHPAWTNSTIVANIVRVSPGQLECRIINRGRPPGHSRRSFSSLPSA